MTPFVRMPFLKNGLMARCKKMFRSQIFLSSTSKTSLLAVRTVQSAWLIRYKVSAFRVSVFQLQSSTWLQKPNSILQPSFFVVSFSRLKEKISRRLFRVQSSTFEFQSSTSKFLLFISFARWICSYLSLPVTMRIIPYLRATLCWLCYGLASERKSVTGVTSTYQRYCHRYLWQL